LAEALDRGEAATLVHIVELKGSGPREVGAQMLVTENTIFGTIGGGALEHAAIRTARDFAAAGRAGLVRMALGPELSQCCGGSVTLAFEPFAPADRAWLMKLVAAADGPVPVYRTLRLDAAGALSRSWTFGESGSNYSVQMSETSAIGAPSPARGKGVAAAEIRELVNPPRHSVWLFGAGHVGRAVANALHPPGFAITWIDGRAGFFPDPPPPGVKTMALAMPELAVEEAPEDAIFLVMTHSHPLDEAICEAVLRRGDFAYLGLIGSKTKRAASRPTG
jgi:xanthine dehydrogenase accessory factor